MNNTTKIVLIAALGGFNLYIAVLFPFVHSNGITLEQSLLVFSIGAFVVAALEVPTGYIGDRWGRKKTMITSMIFNLTAMSFLAATTNFWCFFVSQMLFAIAFTIASGNNTAILYESVKEELGGDNFRKYLRRMQQWALVSQAIACVIGGYIASVNLRLAVILSIPVQVIAFVIACTLQEPKKNGLKKPSFRQCLQALESDRSLLSIIFVACVIMTMFILLLKTEQGILKEMDIATENFGWIRTGLLIASAILSQCTNLVEQKTNVSDRTIIVVASAIALGCLSLTGWQFSAQMVYVFLIGRSMQSVFMPAVIDAMNKKLPDESRSTMLSMMNLGANGCFILIGPLSAWLISTVPLPKAMIIIAIAFTIAISASLLVTRKSWKE